MSASDAAQFRSIVGCLQYLTFTRPYIAYSVNAVCEFLHNPSEVHYNVAKRILCYVKSTLDYGIVFKSDVSVHKHILLKAHISAFCDAYWADDPNNRKFTTGFVIMLNGTCPSLLA